MHPSYVNHHILVAKLQGIFGIRDTVESKSTNDMHVEYLTSHQVPSTDRP